MKQTDRVRSYSDPLAPDEDVRVRDQWISNSTYAEMVEKSIIPCTDSVLIVANDQALYLGKRNAYPMKGVWCLGGRIFFNDRTMEESVARCVELETGLRIKTDRFIYVCTNHYSWVKVAQGDFYGKNLAATYVCEVTKEELEKMAHGLSEKEYDREFGLQRFDRQRLIDEHVHQAMIDVYDDLFQVK
jgi:ADP-ribose pyrophosphatase YjhB (NUDIX family)